MHGLALAPSHLARSLLQLGESRWSGRVRLAGRLLHVDEGILVLVEPGPGDRTLASFLQASGLDAAAGDVEDRDERVLLEAIAERLPARSAADLVRAAWVERLESAIEAAMRRGEAAHGQARSEGTAAAWSSVAPPLFETVLDAIARLGLRGLAEQLGALAPSVRLGWERGRTAERVRRWSGLPGDLDEEAPLVTWLDRLPGATARVAAAVVAGAARLTPRDATEPSDAPSPPGRVRPRPLDRWRPRGEAQPGAHDPLREAEHAIAHAEASGAPEAVRAERWLAMARLWRRHHDAPVEEARCARQAAALAPRQPLIQRAAAEACLRAARPQLALTYADLAREALGPDAEAEAATDRVLAWYARFVPRIGEEAAGRAARRAAVDAGHQGAGLDQLAEVSARGDVREALEMALEMAGQAAQPGTERQNALLAWACTLAPEDPTVRRRVARHLAEAGRLAAAVALLLEGASLTDDPAEARALRVDAAQFAEEGGDVRLAAEALLEAFDVEPHLEVLHEALATDLAAAGSPVRLAVLLEEFALYDEDRASDWLLRAARAHLDASYPSEAVELAGRALLADPTDEALDLLQEASERSRDVAAEADWLERAVRYWAARAPRRAERALRRLGHIASELLQSPPLALWAWSRLESLLGDEESRELAAVWRARAAVRRQALALAERQLDAAHDDAERTEARRALASLLRAWPDDRRRAIALYRELLEEAPGDETARHSLERLFRALGDDDERIALLETWREHLPPGPKRARIGGRLAALHARRRDWRASARVAASAMSDGPPSELLLCRLERAARRTGDLPLLRRALAVQADLVPDAAERAAVHARLAAAHDLLDEGEEAAEEGLAALQHSRRRADAAAILLARLDALPPEHLGDAVAAVREALGDSAPLLRRAANAARSAGRTALAARLLLEATRLPPPSPQLAAEALLLAVESATGPLVLDAAAQLMEVAHLAPGAAAEAFEEAVEQLAHQGQVTLAVRLGLDALDGLAQTSAELPERCLDLAETTDDVGLWRAALERCIARARGSRRTSLLKAVAATHREEGNVHGEVRAWLRVLHETPADRTALRRLGELLDRCGDFERLAEVTALQALHCEDAAERRRILVRRAAIVALGLGRRHEGIEQLRALLQEAPAAERPDLLPRLAATMALWGATEEAIDWLLEETEARREDARAEAELLALEALGLAEEHDGPAAAMRAARRALELFPTSATLLDATEAIAARHGQVDALCAFYREALEQALGRHGRLALRFRWGRWLLRAGEASQACDVLAAGLEEQPGVGVVLETFLAAVESAERWDLAVDVWRSVLRGARDAAVAHQAMEARVDLLDGRLGRPEDAVEALLTGSEAAGLTEALRQRLGGLVGRLGDGPRQRALRAQAAPLLEEARETLVFGLEDDHDAVGQTQPLDASEDSNEEASAREADEPEAEAAAWPHSTNGEPADEPTPGVGAPPSEHTATAVAEDGSDAPVAPVHGGRATWSRWLDPAVAERDSSVRPRHAELERLLARVRAHPDDMEALEALRRSAEQLEAPAVGLAARWVLDARSGRRREERHLPVTPLEVMADPLAAIHGGAPAALWEALRILWEQVGSSLRQPLSHWNILGTERMPIFARRPLAKTHVELVTRLRPGDVVVYLHPLGSFPVRVLPCHPVALALDPAIEERPAQHMRAVLATGVLWARPEHLLLASVPPPEAVPRARAVLAAFGATRQAPADRNGAAFVAHLWETVPPHLQNRLRELLGESDVPDEPERLVAASRRAALRAAWMASGNLGAAFEALEPFGLTADDRLDLERFLFAGETLAALASITTGGSAPEATGERRP